MTNDTQDPPGETGRAKRRPLSCLEWSIIWSVIAILASVGVGMLCGSLARSQDPGSALGAFQAELRGAMIAFVCVIVLGFFTYWLKRAKP